jgi:type I restriction enzyme M protein
MNAQSLVAKVWNFAHVLRDQGVSYQAYISQISYLLFLKMDEERVTQIGEASMLPDGARWGMRQDLVEQCRVFLVEGFVPETARARPRQRR